MKEYKATTILAVRYGKKLVFAGDGQVTCGYSVMKKSAKKIKKLEDYDVLVGFAGAVADAFTLFDLFEEKLAENNGNVTKAAVNLVKEWRMDKYLRRLEAELIVGDKKDLLLLSGNGEIISPDDNVLAIGSGGDYALSAARGILSTKPKMKAKEIAHSAMKIASDICVFTNSHFSFEEINSDK